jgi:S1-C subfamily serine protease
VARGSVRSVVLVVVAAGICGCGGSAPEQPTKAAAATTTVRTTSPADTLSALVARTQSGVVRIEAGACGSQSIGTGFLIGRRLVATVEHVVDGATSIVLKQSGRFVGTGVVIGEDLTRDVALIQASRALHGAILPMATRAPLLGETVAALGFPLGLPLTVTQGSVSGLLRRIPIDGLDRQDMVQTDAAVNPGNSGGPLLSIDSGDVVGLVDLGTSHANGIAFAVSAQVAGPLLQAWRAAPQPIPTASCGSSGTTATSPQASVPSPQPSLSAFTSGFAADRAQFRIVGLDVAAAVSGAPSQSNGALAAEFGALSSRVGQQAALLLELNPPPQFKAQLDDLSGALNTVAADLRAVATAAEAGDAQAAKSAAETLVGDSATVKADDDALSAALGLPATG